MLSDAYQRISAAWHRLLHALQNAPLRTLLFPLASLLVLGLVFLPLAYRRGIDGDEGYYLLAAKLVGQGKVPYSDFFYPQSFLLPYAYGLWMKGMGVGWYSGRLLSGLLAVFAGMLLYVGALGPTKEHGYAFFATLLLSTSLLAVEWYTPVKTYGPATLLGLAGYLFLMNRSRSVWAYSLAGASFGLASDIRLYFVLLIPLAIFWLFLQGSRRDWMKPVGWLLLGGALALAPNLFFLRRDSGAFLFDNVGYHLIRSDYTVVQIILQRVLTGLELVGLGPIERPLGLQFLLLVAGNLYLACRRRRVPLAGWVALALAVACAAPTPTFTQYFSVTVPFLLLSFVELLVGAQLELRFKRFLTAGAIAYFLLFAVGLPVFLHSTDDANHSIATVRAVGRQVDRFDPHQGCISWWPGYFLETDATIFPRMENHFGVDVAHKLSPEKLRRYRIISAAEINQAISRHGAPVVVLSNWLHPGTLPFYRRALAAAGYKIVATLATTEVYRYGAAP